MSAVSLGRSSQEVPAASRLEYVPSVVEEIAAVDGTIPRSRTSSANVTFFPEDATTLDRALGCSAEPAAVPHHRGVGRP